MEAAVADILRRERHARPRLDWIVECLTFLRSTSSSARPPTPQTAAQFVWEQYLVADMRGICEPALPPNVAYLDKQTLVGPFVLQVLCLGLSSCMNNSTSMLG